MQTRAAGFGQIRAGKWPCFRQRTRWRSLPSYSSRRFRFYPRANLRHYRFLAKGIPEPRRPRSGKRNSVSSCGDSRAQSHQSSCEEIRPSLVVGDEKSDEGARVLAGLSRQETQHPFWTVDEDCIVPSKLLGKKAHTRRTSSGRDYNGANSGASLVPPKNTKAGVGVEKSPPPPALQSLDPGVLRSPRAGPLDALGWSGVRLFAAAPTKRSGF